jgi:glycosyltransferase involved in cell wall biosynthesis
LFSIALFLFIPIYVLVKRPHFVIAEPYAPTLALMWKPLLSWCTHLRVILDIRSTPVEIHGFANALKSLLFKISILIAKRVFDGITIISAGMKDSLARDFRIDPDLIGVWSDGVSTRLFDPTVHVAEGLQLREKNHLSNAFVIFYHGAMTVDRGIVEAVRSIGILSESGYDDVVLFLLGSGPMLPAIKALVHDRGLEGRVILHDVVDYTEVPKYIAMSDAGIVPLPKLSDWIHQCPLNLLEYLAMEKPVILTDILGNRSIVGDSKCGTYVADANSCEFAKAIMHLHDNKKMLKQWGAQGRRIVREKYDWSKVAELFEQYLRTCGNGGVRIKHDPVGTANG